MEFACRCSGPLLDGGRTWLVRAKKAEEVQGARGKQKDLMQVRLASQSCAGAVCITAKQGKAGQCILCTEQQQERTYGEGNVAPSGGIPGGRVHPQILAQAVPANADMANITKP